MQPPHSAFVASFTFACPEYHVPPRVRTTRVSKVRVASHKLAELVEVFPHETPPTQHYQVLGGVEVVAQTKKNDREELLAKAREAAEKMGGDALVDLRLRDAGTTRPQLGPRGMLVLTALVARWE